MDARQKNTIHTHVSRLVHDRPAASDDVVGFRLASLHGHERRQPAEDLGLQKRVVADLLQQTLEAPNRIGRRSGTEQERDHEPLDYLPFLEAVTGASGMLERAFRGLCARLHVAVEVVRLGDEAPGARQPELVVELVERGDRPLRDIDELARRHLRSAEEAKKAPLHERMCGKLPIAGRGGGLNRLREYSIRPGQVGDALDDADVRNEVDPQRIGGRQHRDGARDEVHAREGVATQERSPAGRSEPLGGPPAERAAVAVERAEVGVVS